MTAYDIAVITDVPRPSTEDPEWEIFQSPWRKFLRWATRRRWTTDDYDIVTKKAVVPHGNLCHTPIYIDTTFTESYDPGVGPEDERVHMLMTYRGYPTMAPVFALGEILLLDPVTEREVTGSGRKPSKWYVGLEYVDTLDEAIALSQRVTGYRSDKVCWPKTGWMSGETYCGVHGRDAGWPCAVFEKAVGDGS